MWMMMRHNVHANTGASKRTAARCQPMVEAPHLGQPANWNETDWLKAERDYKRFM
jgi:hypothetical protein